MKTYRSEKWSSDKVFVFVNEQEDERERGKNRFNALVLE